MLHRLPEQHECLFDHLGRGRQEAVLKMVKLDRKVGRSCQRIGEECSWATFPPFPRISVFRQCLSTNRDYIIFFFLLSFLFFQDFSRIFWIQTSASFLFKLCSLLFWGGGIPLLLPLYSASVGLIISLLLRCLLGKKGNTEFLHLFASSWLHTSERSKNE